MHNLKVAHTLVMLFTGRKALQSTSKLRSRQRTFTKDEMRLTEDMVLCGDGSTRVYVPKCLSTAHGAMKCLLW